MSHRIIDNLLSWLLLPVIALMLLIAEALEGHAERPRKEAGDES